MKFSALNREASSSSTLSTTPGRKGAPTQEAQESACLQLYHTAMKHQQDGEMEKAKAIYREILESEIMDVVCSDGSASIATNTIFKLKYLIYKNFASIARDQGDLSAAVDAYIEASKVDTTDITMWCHLASAASSLGNLILARKALEQALCCNGEYWPAIEALCSVLLALEDFHSCLLVIDKGLQLDPDFPRGLVFLNHIFQRCPDAFNYQFSELRLHLMKPCPPDKEKFLKEARDLSKKRESLLHVIVVQEPISPPKKLDRLTISALGRWLLATYCHCKEISKKTPSYTVEVDLSTTVTETTVEECPMPFSSPQKKTCPSTSTAEEPSSSNSTAATTSAVSQEEGALAKKESRKRMLDEPFAPKRRSNRVKSKRRDVQQVNHFDVLKNFLPSWLKLSELPEIIELSPLIEPRKKKKDDRHGEKEKQAAVLLESSPKLNDKETTKDFLSKHQHNYGIINLLYKFVEFLALHYNWKWDGAVSGTAKTFVDIYEHLHKHLCYPSPFCSIEEAQETEFTNMAMIALFYVELYLDQLSNRRVVAGGSGGKKSSNESGISGPHPKCFHQCLVFVEQCVGLVGAAGRERLTFSLRVQWCVVKWKLLLKNNDEAVPVLERCERLLSSLTSGDGAIQVCLPNCREEQIISLDVVQEKRQQLEQSTSIKQIHSLFAGEDYEAVVDKLLPLLDEESSTLLEFLLGSESCPSNESTGLSLLLQSLLKLKHYHSCLQSAVQALLHLLRHCKLGNSKWYTSMWDSWNALDSCLTFDQEDKREEMLEKTDLRLLKRLVVCILKTMDTYCTAADAPVTSNMPVCLPWKILYIILTNKWKAAATDKPVEDEPMEHTSHSLPQPTASELNTSAVVDMECGDKEDHHLSQLQTPVAQSNNSQSESVHGGSASSHVPSSASSPEPQQLALPLRYLKEAHEYLGSQGWCCRDAGCFLLASVDALRAELKVLTKLPVKHREMLFLELEQCYYCLFGYPFKKPKARGLVDHESEQVPLKWDSALMLMEYYHPTHLPSIDDTKQQVTSELVQLYMKITDIVPEHGKVLSKETLTDYIEGKLEQLPEPSPPHQQSSLMSELYYLLADDYLKSGDNHKALWNYLLNLCYCPDRFDSWAGLALARSRLIVERINSRVFKSGTEKYIQKQTAATVRCFKKAVSLNSKHCYIIEKFGLFCYCVQSIASQILRQPDVFTSEELKTWASSTRREMLTLAETYFTVALQLEGTRHAEPWIYHLMLGKIGPKLDRPVGQSLEHFNASAEILHREGAGYPDLVELAAVKHHAVQAIEVHYQLYSCALKSLLKNKLKVEDNKKEREKSISESILKVQSLPLGAVRYPSLWSWLCEVTGVENQQLPSLELTHKMSKSKIEVREEESVEKMDIDVTSDPQSCSFENFDGQHQSTTSSLVSVVQRPIDLSTMSDVQKEHTHEGVEAILISPPSATDAVGSSTQPTMVQGSTDQLSSDVSYEQLVVKCLYAVSVCAVRCPAYFKPLYRIAKAMLSLGFPKLARDILLGPLPAVLGELQEKLLPLFVLKANIFSNMWQIPAEEINRPGTFSTHARKNLNLLLAVLSDLKEASSLLLLAQHLRNKPDVAKQYLRENERVAMYKKVVKLCVQVLKFEARGFENLSVVEASKLKAAAVSIRPMAARLDHSNQTFTKTLDEAMVQFDRVIDKDKEEPTDKESGSVNLDTGKLAEPKESSVNEDRCMDVVASKEPPVTCSVVERTEHSLVRTNEKQLTQQQPAVHVEPSVTIDASTQHQSVIQS